jgi:hypothetical protein
MNDPLYHVTYMANLGDIAADGLVPGRRSAIGSMALDHHRAGRIFLTEFDGVPYWFSRAEDFAVDMSDDPADDELVPVVLRINDPPDDDLQEDVEGSRDARRDAYYCECAIDAAQIDVFDGEAWVAIADAELDADDAVDEDGYTLDPSPFQPDSE